MKLAGTIAPTDFGWYEFLRGRTGLREANFWTPSATHAVRAPKFSPFLFKLKAPHNAIGGYAFYAAYDRLPDWLAWETFGVGSGCADLGAMRGRVGDLRSGINFRGTGAKNVIGCVHLVDPVFFEPGNWVVPPSDWPVRSQRATRFELGAGDGRRVWEACLERGSAAAERTGADASLPFLEPEAARYGAARLVEPRLGQGTFRIAVMQAYERACAVTGEHSLPALEAAHIRSFAEDGPHDVRNGMLLRADLHRLFDQGYVTITPALRFEVSPR
ncbi:MAG: HNH endonuclease, partial [Stellaceae bacterium]